MALGSIRLSRLLNEEHSSFQTEFKNLIDEFTPEKLDVEEIYASYKTLYAKEFKLLHMVRKSTITDELIQANKKRNDIIKGFCSSIKSACNHYSPDVKQAAKRLKMLVGTSGKLVAKPYQQKTGAIHKLVDELQNSYADNIATVGLGGWVSELEASNNEFELLINLRFDEKSGRSKQNMRSVRLEVDEAYRAVVKRIDALIELQGPDNYADFVTALNQRTKHFGYLLARREGHRKSKKKEVQDTDKK